MAHHGSGEIFLGFSTSGRVPRGAVAAASVADDVLNPLFAATVDAAEESVLNALWAAPDVAGRRGRRTPGLPHAAVLELLREQHRLS